MVIHNTSKAHVSENGIVDDWLVTMLCLSFCVTNKQRGKKDIKRWITIVGDTSLRFFNFVLCFFTFLISPNCMACGYFVEKQGKLDSFS